MLGLMLPLTLGFEDLIVPTSHYKPTSYNKTMLGFRGNVKSAIKKRTYLPNSVAEIKADGMDTGGKVLGYGAVAVVEPHEGTTHVETEVSTDAEQVVCVVVIVGNHGYFELTYTESEVRRDDHSILIVRKGEGITKCHTLESEMAFGERVVVVEVKVTIGDAGIETKVVVDTSRIPHRDV